MRKVKAKVRTDKQVAADVLRRFHRGMDHVHKEFWDGVALLCDAVHEATPGPEKVELFSGLLEEVYGCLHCFAAEVEEASLKLGVPQRAIRKTAREARAFVFSGGRKAKR